MPEITGSLKSEKLGHLVRVWRPDGHMGFNSGGGMCVLRGHNEGKGGGGGRVIHRIRMGNEEGNCVHMPRHTKREKEKDKTHRDHSGD